MDNRIRSLTWSDRPSPAGAEVWITVTPEHVTSTTDVRGHLSGPRCPWSHTVEVAYPLRSPRWPGEGSTDLTRRVVIPEASLWEPECPFVYEGVVELWQDGQCVDQLAVRHGLRTLMLTAAGLRLNGTPLTLHGGRVAGTRGEAEDVANWRRRGWNLLVVEVDPTAVPLWNLADRFGFLVLGLASRWPDESTTTVALANDLTAHPSCLGWLLPSAAATTQRLAGRVGVLFAEGQAPPSDVSFVAGGPELARLGLPLLLTGGTPGPLSPPAFGWVEAS